MATHVRDVIANLGTDGPVVDLFSGMGSVAESLCDTAPVITNDAMSFTAALSRARFTGAARGQTPMLVAERLKGDYETRLARLVIDNADQLASEDFALAGTQGDLQRYMSRAKHVGNAPQKRRDARLAAESSGLSHYRLATLYFSAGYLGLRQSLQVDALRAAIDADDSPEERDWLLAAWISGTSVLVNAPGHTAQFLKPNTSSSHARIVRMWSRSIWDEFVRALTSVDQVGTEKWRSQNSVYVADALDLVSSGALAGIGTVYADPPYTKDQYSRFYHLYETLYRYDFPDSTGAGRNRSDRFTTGFSLKSAVVASFHDLCRNVARLKVPLVVSYPSVGLLDAAGATFPGIAREYFRNVETRSIDANHSTLGASSGASKKAATENLYVCTN